MPTEHHSDAVRVCSHVADQLELLLARREFPLKFLVVVGSGWLGQEESSWVHWCKMVVAVGTVAERCHVWDCHTCCTDFVVHAAQEDWMDKVAIAWKRMPELELVQQLVVVVVHAVCWQLQRVVVLERLGNDGSSEDHRGGESDT